MRKLLLLALLAMPALANSPAICLDTPKDRWDITSACSDYDLDWALIDALEHGDRSASALLERRYDTVLTYGEQQTIAGALLGRVCDDSKYWNELYTWAQRALLSDDELRALAAKAGVDEHDYRFRATGALLGISYDARSNALLRRALSSSDGIVLMTAINGLGFQHDTSALDVIEKTILRFDDPDRRASLAQDLATFDSDAAEEVAMRYLRGSYVDDYKAERESVHGVRAH